MTEARRSRLTAWVRSGSAHLFRPNRRPERDRDGEKSLWSRRKTKVYFDNQDLDVYLSFILGRAAARGASLGESVVAASGVSTRDPASWARAWTVVATAARRHADGLADVDPVGARDAYLRATSYHRAAMFGQGVEDARRSHAAAVETFRRFVTLTDVPIEAVTVSWDGWTSPGYFIRAGDTGKPAPTVLLFLGGETMAEDAWVWIGEAGARRGWNTFVAEPPSFFGFRAANPAYPAVTWSTIEPFLKPYVDAVLAQPTVDASRLVAAGFSGGGFLALRAAGTDQRIRALVADAPILDFNRLATAEFPRALRSAPTAVMNSLIAAAGRRDPFLARTLEKFLWQFAVQEVREFFDAFAGTSNEELIPRLSIPVLALSGEGESEEQRRQAEQVFAGLSGPKHLRIFTAAEGAEAHTQVNHPALMQETVFAWLADVWGRPCREG
ncbi:MULTISPECIES: alpha/beta hydrolase [unclassified Geodermatophilus]|uniref:alpha/beta hydrolase n=1 Tax=unclassified Geodermatophilus TaxID=2637632 RepID=UPI003EEC431B